MLQLGILLITAVLIALDQFTKWLAVSNLEFVPEPVPVIEGFISFKYIPNYGAAWGMFEGQQWLLIGLTSVLVFGMLIVLLSGRFRKHKLANIGGIMVIAGGIGNLIDRVRLGYVIDFIKTDFIDFPIFNVADCLVVIGAATLFIYFVFIYSDTPGQKGGFRRKGKKEELPSGNVDDHTSAGSGGDEA